MPAADTGTDREMVEASAGTKLFEQIEQGDFVGMVEMLSKSKIGLEHLDENANSPFLYACYLGRYPFVKYLVECGANIERINIFGQNALALATYGGDQKTCEYLVHVSSFEAYNRSSICSPLFVAVLTENIELVKYFTKLEYDGVSGGFLCESATTHGVCPLKLAMLQRHKQIIGILRPTHARHFTHSS